MNDELEIRFEQIEGVFDDPLETATFARLWLQLGERVLTRAADRRSGMRDYLKLPLHQLAAGLAENWWTLLYEPWRPEEAVPKRIARHRLDAYVTGYVFPLLGIWSAGDEVVTITTGQVERFSPVPDPALLLIDRKLAARFEGAPLATGRSLSRIELVDERRDRVSVSRRVLESQLFDFVDTVVSWIAKDALSDVRLLERWSSVVRSINDPNERNYCAAAGRLGLDPYDSETPDISVFAAELPEDSFDDLCDAAPFDELASASAWVSREQSMLEHAPVIDLEGFGSPLALDTHLPAWEAGYRAATLLRRRLMLDDNPRKATQRLIGAENEHGITDASPVVEGVLAREDNRVRSRVVARSNAQWRFRECRAAYLGWSAEPGAYPLLTTASTYRQQASRAFAAELLCPAEYLRHIAGHRGLTTDQVIDVAEALDCQTMVVEHQAYNHGIPVRGLYY